MTTQSTDECGTYLRNGYDFWENRVEVTSADDISDGFEPASCMKLQGRDRSSMLLGFWNAELVLKV